MTHTSHAGKDSLISKNTDAALDEAQPRCRQNDKKLSRAQHFSTSNVEIPYSTSAGEDALHVQREEDAPRSHVVVSMESSCKHEWYEVLLAQG